jgi:hypothetical protein
MQKILADFKTRSDMFKAFDDRANLVQEKTVSLRDVNFTLLKKLRQSHHTLRRVLFGPTAHEITVPTCFLILNQKTVTKTLILCYTPLTRQNRLIELKISLITVSEAVILIRMENCYNYNKISNNRTRRRRKSECFSPSVG